MNSRALDELGYIGYQIREDGMVITPQGNIVGGYKRGGGQRSVKLRMGPGLGAKLVSIRQLVAWAFVPNPNPTKYRYVKHKDGNKSNDHYTNLFWAYHPDQVYRGS